MILCITLNPIIDKLLKLNEFTQGKSAHVQEVKLMAGGKGNNVARVLKNLGFEVMAFNLLGGFEGKQFKSILEAEKLNNSAMWINNRTRTHIFHKEENFNRLTDFYEPSPEISEKEKKLLLIKIKNLIKRCKLVVMSGSSPCKITDDVFYEVARLANSYGIKAIIDSSQDALKISLNASPFLIKPNKEETEEIINKKINNSYDIIEALDFYQSKNIKFIVISMGKDGAFIRYNRKTYKSTTPDIPVLNPFGSGDCMVAGFIKGIFENRDIEDIISLGMAAGTANAARSDIALINEKDINKFLPEIKVKLISK